ncbi:MAG: FecR domain-containing protein [Candidatus Thiodiazotropha sp.]|nr:FecR domain-containing protein [Candidatus Thiodiazotropha sp.]MCM8883004.1 FecR domain-containing protein [Candidatus Thiodiazotropha sp.]
MQHCLNISMLAKYSLTLLVLLLPEHLLAAECEPVAKLISLEGAVETKRANEETWHSAALKQGFCTGDTLRTGYDSRAAVRLTNETLLRLDGDSALTFTHVEKKTRSIIDLLLGAVHFISRTPKSLEVRTPYVNASIEGTEFVVQIKESATNVTVFEGLVVATNTAGSIELAANQTAHAASNQAPVRIAKAIPLEAVTWALYYPPLPEQPDAADTLAQQTITAIAQNRIDEAAELAKQARVNDSQSAAAYMAQSYVDQAQFNIPAALANSQKAAELAPQSALTQARLAEVWLMTGNTKSAQQAANQAVALDPKLSLSHTVLGFASLREVNLDAAMAAFEAAINLDSAAPLPRLGLGLVKIRQGALQSGREEIETAVLLDPGNALLRSYIGKAYYEEKRNSLASEQFAMAKTLDPNDPTAWFYDSILLQSDNRPVEALQAQQQAIELNDNRGVYRSRQLLDQDEAARSVALGRIYSDLNFEQQARYQATDALMQDPGNHSAHRLLADSYSGITNLDAARQSELLQSKMTQPLNLDPLQPQLSNSNLGLLDGNGPGELSYNEYNPLFTRNGLAFQFDASIAEENTWSNDAIIAGLYDRFAFSLGQYQAETDGFRMNADYEQDLYNIFAQFAFSDRTLFQIEVSQDEVVKGDVSQRLLPSLLTDETLRVDTDTTSYRIGLNHAISPDTRVLFTTTKIDYETTANNFELLRNNDTKINTHDLQLQYNSGAHRFIGGISFNRDEFSTASTFDFSPLPCQIPLPDCTLHSKFTEKQSRLYGYYFYQPSERLNLTTAISATRDTSEIFSEKETRILPKLGAQWSLNNDSVLRAAVFKTRSSAIGTSFYQTLEPTHIAGFNQIHDEFRQTDTWNYGLSFNHQFMPTLSAGIQGLHRDGETPFELLNLNTFSSSMVDVEFGETSANAWVNWSPYKFLSLNFGYSVSDLDSATNINAVEFSGISPDGVIELETHRLPVTINYYHPSGFIIGVAATYTDQKGVLQGSSIFDSPQDAEDTFWLTDLLLSYRLPNKHGLVSLGVKNVFDKEFNFEDRNSYDSLAVEASASPSSLSPERVVYGQISLTFR